MRIDGPNRTNSVAGRSQASRSGSGPAFVPAGEHGAARVSNATPVAPTAGLDAILALQAVGDFRESRRRAVKRGSQLLDLLEDLKADLLVGGIGAGQLDALAGQIAGLRERVDPALDALVDEIELRVLVELAKRGRYPQG
ncbi:flagellar assembly protein FliX [Devosia chinhatensis]|uniref:Flagellar assembly protein FliX n=1 Tax=Devosia chinhatensis TaxID=429727 RepID=A0A0F5FNH6_9HYPH|nr:flagellar assembly protein FliX [Devosia chinhatensis]KKB10383.1 hypothetical protein VE26_08820 [Devosia chinhatensis]